MEGVIRKLQVENDKEVQYYLNMEDEKLHLNPLVGKIVGFQFLNQISCLHCGSTIKKSYGQGYCFPCFRSIPQTEECVLRPEMCRAHEGVARDIEFAKTHCLIDHYVYLANTGGLKVGVTRHHQVPVRWIDQGASEAVILAKTPNRYLAGTLEVALKSLMPDKTNWRKMLSAEASPMDLSAEKDKVAELLPFDMQQYLEFEDNLIRITYPVRQYPVKIKTISFDKVPEVKGVLAGIKGQYLIFDDGRVLNIRKHSGYKISVNL